MSDNSGRLDLAGCLSLVISQTGLKLESPNLLHIYDDLEALRLVMILGLENKR